MGIPSPPASPGPGLPDVTVAAAATPSVAEGPLEVGAVAGATPAAPEPAVPPDVPPVDVLRVVVLPEPVFVEPPEDPAGGVPAVVGAAVGAAVTTGVGAAVGVGVGAAVGVGVGAAVGAGVGMGVGAGVGGGAGGGVCFFSWPGGTDGGPASAGAARKPSQHDVARAVMSTPTAVREASAGPLLDEIIRPSR